MEPVLESCKIPRSDVFLGSLARGIEKCSQEKVQSLAVHLQISQGIFWSPIRGQVLSNHLKAAKISSQRENCFDSITVPAAGFCSCGIIICSKGFPFTGSPFKRGNFGIIGNVRTKMYDEIKSQ